MFVRRHRDFRLRTTCVVALIAVLSLCAGALADEHEDPWVPTGIGAGSPTFGGITVDPQDTPGNVLDAKETLEPTVTVLLTMGDLADFTSQPVAVVTQPVFESWNQ